MKTYLLTTKLNSKTRLPYAIEELKKVGISDYSIWFGEIHSARETGCTASHRNIILDAKKSDQSEILVFEDDVISFSGKEYVQKIINITKNDNDCDIFYLGFTTKPKTRIESKITNDVFQVSGCNGTHAIVYKKRIFDRLLNNISLSGHIETKNFKTVHIDIYLSIESSYKNIVCHSSEEMCFGTKNGWSSLALIDKEYSQQTDWEKLKKLEGNLYNTWQR